MSPASRTTTDADFVADTAEVLSVPRTERNSFTLHAPLELLARAELLPHVDAASHHRARERLTTLAAGFAASGDEVASAPPLDVDDGAGALLALHRAIAEADPELADSAATWLAERLSAAEIAAALTGPLVLEMGAAGHAPILFASYLRSPDADTRPLRGVARRLAEYPDIRVRPEWLEPPGRRDGTPDDLEVALSALVRGDDPGWGIFLLVEAVHRDGITVHLPRVADDDIDEGFRRLFRVAARSMIEDDPAHAPYGWSHALTIPLGIRQTLHLHSRHREAFGVASMLAAGFRYGHGSVPLTAGSVAPERALPFDGLASRASVQHDAHLVKYVLACKHASELDPESATLYHRAAEHLVDWWDANPAADDPLA